MGGGDGALERLDWRIWYLEQDDGVVSAPTGVCSSTSIATFILTTLEKVYHARRYLLPLPTIQDLGYLVGTYTISFLLLHTCIYHILISVCYLQGYSFSTCLVSFSTHVTSRSHVGLPNIMYRVLLGHDFERTGNDDSVRGLSEL